MRNRVLVILVVVVIALGGYTAYWFKKSSDYKQILEQLIAQVNENAKTKKDVPTIKYDSIDVTGFPFSMQYNINKPVFDIPVSEISKEALHSTPATPVDFTVEASYDLISISANIAADNFSAGYSGKTLVTPTLNGKAGNAIEMDTAAPVFCHMKIHNDNYMPWNVPNAFADGNAFFTAFRGMDCRIDGATSKDAAAGTVLSTLESLQLSLESAPVNSANHKLALLVDIKNAKATPAYDTLVNYYFQLFYTLAGVPENQRNNSLNLSQYGEQNSKIQISYEGPVAKEGFFDPAANIRFDLNALNFKNDIYEFATEAHMSNLNSSTARNDAVTLHWSMVAGEPYEHLIAQQIAKMIRQSAANPADPEFAAQLAAYGNPDDIAAAVVPKFHTMGKINFDADLAATGQAGKDFLKSGDFSISQLDLINSQYGVKIKGKGKAGTSFVPTGELFATCVLCDTMVDSLASYATGIDAILAKTRPGQTPYVTAQLVAGIKQFLHAIDEPATDKAPGNILIHVVSAENAMPTISGKQVPEVLVLYATYIAPNLAQPKPAAAIPAPTASAKKKTTK